MSRTGLVLLAHGARDARWSAPFENVARRIAAKRPALALRCAYLDFMTPDLEGACAELVDGGCTRVDVQPMFLGTGGHVRKDLPRLLGALRGRWPDVHFALHDAIGEVDAVMQAMADAALAAIPTEEREPRE